MLSTPKMQLRSRIIYDREPKKDFSYALFLVGDTTHSSWLKSRIKCVCKLTSTIENEPDKNAQYINNIISAITSLPNSNIIYINLTRVERKKGDWIHYSDIVNCYEQMEFTCKFKNLRQMLHKRLV